jgi:hypothetical protein
MLSRTQVLTAGAILRPDDVVAIADASALELAAAAALLVMESGGGRNVWGHDVGDTGGTSVKGAPVTRDAYLAYRAAVARGEIGRQGVGPTQLTNGELQAAADGLGGCWDWVCNARTGFSHLAALIKSYGDREGFRRYNGSGPAAEQYADTALRYLAQWRARLANTEDDVALTDDDVAKVAAAAAKAVLAELIPDYAKDPSGQTGIALGISEAWEATHVGDVLTKTDALIAKIDALGAHLGVKP